MNYFQDTIAALASPSGEGGIAVVRISGPLAPDILKKMFRGGPTLFDNWQTHHLYYGRLLDIQENLLDHALAVWMKAPRTFTGEDVVEFHIHGGRLISLKVLEAIYHCAARPALPGEFSQRAFLNGKMDLTQAEAVADMISAQSEQALKLAQDQWSGALSKPVSELRKKLLDALVYLEAAIDFPEEEIEFAELSQIQEILESSYKQLKAWIIDYELGRMIREGLSVVLVGKPNVGKSSLLNYLVREEAAIVHDEPGTTRDIIERKITLGGLLIRLLDTAGIRETQEKVEQIGIQRTKAHFERADLVLALFDSSVPLGQEDLDLAKSALKRKSLFLINKSDLKAQWLPDDLFPASMSAPYLNISLKTHQGLSELEKGIPELFGIHELGKGSHLLINQLRHKQALEQAAKCLELAILSVQKNRSPELIASEVMRATQFVGEIIGEISSEHILEDIFGRFCIGK